MPESSEVAAVPSLEAQMLASLEKVSPESAIPESKADSGSGKITPVEEAEETEEVVEDADDEEAATEDGDEQEGAADADTEDAEESEPVDEEFAEAMKKRGITTDLSDVPKELRSVLLDKVKAMDAGYTKVRQEAAQFRSEKAAFESEKTYQKDHMDQYVADLLGQHPDLLEQVNEEMDRRKDTTYTKALAKERETAKREAAVQEKEREQQEHIAAQRQVEAERLDTHVEQAAKSAGLPIELVAEAITLLTQKVMRDDDRLPTEAEIDALIDRHAKVYKKHIGANKAANSRKNTRDYLDSKRQDKADASSSRKPSGAVTTTAGLPTKKPASLEEALNAKLDQLGMVA